MYDYKIKMTIYKGNIIFTPSPDRIEVLEHGNIIVDDNGKIQAVYSDGNMPECYSSCKVVDYGDKLLIPAMCDLHVHAPQYHNMGMAMNLELLPWLQTYVFPEERRYADPAYARVMYRHFVNEMLLQGTTRSAVFATIHPEATIILAEEFAKAGMSAKIGLVGMDRNCPEYLSNTSEEVVKGTMELMEATKEYPLVDAIVTPRFVPSCTDKMLCALGKLAADQSLPVQSHLSENKNEIALVKELAPQSSCYGDVYAQHGLFGQTPTLMAHCCYSDGQELELMKKNGVIVVHCPTSNCNLASGIAPIRRFLDEGIQVTLGSDVAGGHNLSMFKVMQYTQQMSKLLYAQSGGEMKFLQLSEVLYMATKSGGSFFGKVGSFEEAYSFDALVIDDSSLNETNLQSRGEKYTILERLERFIYLGDERMIEARFCEGRLLRPFKD